ncbi:MAG: hypothetical protein HY342_09145 [Candidatus Lambdaproteobacteria bacterium]|nr:hypothetical protein [Candidatus Lambdaproteobacteria bacterium]
MWQGLFEGLQGRNFMVVAVAMDSRDDAARPWIEAANPGYLALIDRHHLLADLYNMVNVPQAVWIDEHGRIVRPTEVAGSYEGFRWRDRNTGKLPDEIAATTKAAKLRYVEAVRDWVLKGPSSAFAFDEAAARAHLSLPSADVALAHAAFRMGQALLGEGRIEEAQGFLDEARRRHPESWNIWRQCYKPNELGLAAGPEFWERVQALGDKRYYAHVDMPEMP